MRRVKGVRRHDGRALDPVVRANAERVWVEYCLKRRRKGCGFDMIADCAGARVEW